MSDVSSNSPPTVPKKTNGQQATKRRGHNISINSNTKNVHSAKHPCKYRRESVALPGGLIHTQLRRANPGQPSNPREDNSDIQGGLIIIRQHHSEGSDHVFGECTFCNI